MRDLKVALIQSNLHWENIPSNLKMFEEKISRIVEQLDIIVLPEMFSTGFTMANAQHLAEEMTGSAVQWMSRIARENNCAVTGSLIIRENGKIFNRLIWADANGNFFSYDKRHLFSLTGEQKVFTEGKEKLIAEASEWKILPLVCYDLRFPVWSRQDRSSAIRHPSYDILIYVANWPQVRIEMWKKLLPARAIENQCYVIGVNRVGIDGNGVYHSGDSMVVNALGEILYHKTDDEDVKVITLDPVHLMQTRQQFPFLKDGDEFTIHS